MSDEKLLRRVARGDRAAFDELYRRTAPWLAPLTWPAQPADAPLALGLATALAPTGAGLHAALGVQSAG